MNIKTKCIPFFTKNGFIHHCDPDLATHLKLRFPIEDDDFRDRVIRVKKDDLYPNEPVWQWDGNVCNPTISPSLLTVDEDRCFRCHSFITAGNIRFLPDCTHELKGSTAELIDVNPDSI